MRLSRLHFAALALSVSAAALLPAAASAAELSMWVRASGANAA